MIPKLIKDEANYEATLSRIDELMDAKPDTPEGDELELLVVLVEKYEEEFYPMEAPTPIEAIFFRMEQMGLKRSDLVPILGSSGRVSDVMNQKRKLSINQIRALHKQLGIPYESLMQETVKTKKKLANSRRRTSTAGRRKPKV